MTLEYKIGDCLELMKDIPDNSIDLVVMDPPYNIGKDSWDKIDNYIDWMGNVFTELERVLKENGSMYFFHNDFLQMCDLQQWLGRHSGFIFKQMITWNKIHPDFKNSGFVHQRLSIDMQRNYYNGFTEYCLYYTFQDATGLERVMLDTENFQQLRQYFKEFQEALICTKKDILNQIGSCADHCFRWNSTQWDLPTKETYEELCKLPLKNEFIRKEYEELRKEYEELRKEYEELRFTFNVANVSEDVRANSNVWLYPPAKQQGHITPKPLELIKNIIKHSSNENNLILDPFLGSGTTLRACRETNRNCIGFEKKPEYESIIRKRAMLDTPNLIDF